MITMDWYSWLSNSGLEPALVYEYSLLFTHNELEESDAAHFTHDFLQSMGVSIAKHRLHILSLAKKQQRRGPAARLVAAVARARRRLARCVRAVAARRDDGPSSAIVIVPARPAYGGWRGAMLKRNKRVQAVGKHRGRLMMITDGGGGGEAAAAGSGWVSRSSSPMVYVKNGEEDEEGDGFWDSCGGDLKWDTMFQDLKPT